MSDEKDYGEQMTNTHPPKTAMGLLERLDQLICFDWEHSVKVCREPHGIITKTECEEITPIISQLRALLQQPKSPLNTSRTLDEIEHHLLYQRDCSGTYVDCVNVDDYLEIIRAYKFASQQPKSLSEESIRATLRTIIENYRKRGKELSFQLLNEGVTIDEFSARLNKTIEQQDEAFVHEIIEALLPHLASAQAAQGHEAIRIAVANYVQSEGCDCCQGGNHSEHKKALAELLKVPMYSDGSGYDFNAILAANEQDGK